MEHFVSRSCPKKYKYEKQHKQKQTCQGYNGRDMLKLLLEQFSFLFWTILYLQAISSEAYLNPLKNL